MTARAVAAPGSAASTTVGRLLRALAVCLLPVLVGLYSGATTFGGGSFRPWHPVMVDLDVYRRAGRLLLQGGDVYNLPGQLPFLYPPFAALLAVPLALLPATLVQMAWTAASSLAMLAVLFRFGLTGWGLSLVTSAVVFLVVPVSQTLAFGQLGIFLVALVLLDLAPGPRLLGARRLLPEGTLTGLATAIKLTPAIFLLYLLLVRRRRAAATLAATFVAVSLVSAAVLPSESLTFWTRLAHGSTGLGSSIVYYVNQSVLADSIRILGLGSLATLVGLALSAVVALVGVWAAAVWHGLAEVRLAVSLCGVAGLLASPVSWLHHFVWIVPLGLCLLEGRGLSPIPRPPGGAPTPARTALPSWARVIGWLFIGWVMAAPFQRLPNGGNVELTYRWSQNVLASTTAVLGTALLVAAVVSGRRLTRSRLSAGRR